MQGILLLLLWVLLCLWIIAGNGIANYRDPAPRWWWHALWSSYIGAIFTGITLRLLLSSASLARDKQLQLLRQATLTTSGLPSLLWTRLRSLFLQLLGVLVLLGLAWTIVARGGIPSPSSLVWLHLELMCYALGLAALLMTAQIRGWSFRAAGMVAVMALVFLISSVVWAPSLMPDWISSRVHAPILLLSNPLLASYTAAGQDILRQGRFYEISSLGSSRFSYPDPIWTLLPGLVAILISRCLLGKPERWNRKPKYPNREV